MKKLRRSPGLAMAVLVAFLTFVTFGTTLPSCGGGGSSSDSGGGGDDGDDGTTTPTFDTFQTATTDSNGVATFTTTKLTNAQSARMTFTLPNGQPASGMTVDFSETTDGHVIFVVYDPSGVYQTMIISADVSALTSTDVSAPGEMYLHGSGKGSPVSFRVVPADSLLKEPFTIGALVLIAGASLVATFVLIPLVDKANKLSGSIETDRLLAGQPACFSFNTLLDYYEIGSELIGLVFWAGETIGMAGTNVTTDALYEILLSNVVDSIKDEVEQQIWDAISSTVFAKYTTVAMDTKMCWQLYNPFSKFTGQVYESRPDYFCNTSTDCDNMTPTTAKIFDNVDQDMDGYTPALSDCNDMDRRIYPGAFEVCDSNVDYNCDGALTTCNVTTNLYMDKYPELGSLTDGSSGDITTLVEVQGSFIGMGSDSISDARLIINNDPDQKLVLNDYGYGQYGFFTFVSFKPGINKIQVAAEGGTHYGSKTYYFTNVNSTESLKIMLSWDACPSLDLYVVEPDSATLHLGAATGNYGSLVYTTTGGWGPQVYKADNPAAGQTYFYYVKHNGNGTCGASGYSANYTINVYTPSGTIKHTGAISEGQTSAIRDVMF